MFAPTRPPSPRRARLAGAAVVLAALGLAGAANGQSQSAAQKALVDVFAARTGLPRAWVASIKPGMVVAIRDRDAPRNAGDKIRLQGEVIDEEAAGRLGYKSMRSVVEVNCETHRDRVVEMEVFGSPNLKGEGQARKLPGGWVQPSGDAYMADVIRAVCRGQPRLEVASEDPPPPKAPPKPAPKPIPPKPQPTAMAAAPAPALRPVAAPPRPPSPDGPIATGPRPPRLLVAEAEAAPPPSPVPAPPPPQKAAPQKPAPQKPAPSKPAARPPSPSPSVAAATPAGPLAQVGSLSSEANARRALAGLSALTGPGLGTRIQPATVDGRAFYRAFVTGFASRADAAAFCARVTAKGGPCLVR